MNLKKIGKVLTSKSVGTGPSSYEKRIYRAAVSQRLRNIRRETMRKEHTEKERSLSEDRSWSTASLGKPRNLGSIWSLKATSHPWESELKTRKNAVTW